MKKDRSITIRRVPVVSSAGADTNFVVVRVFYGIGGMNYFSGRNESRGYYLSATPETHGDDGVVSFTAFSGRKVFLQGAPRFSQSKLEEVAGAALSSLSDKTNALVLRVMRDDNLEKMER